MADLKALEVLKQSVRLWNENWNSLNRDLSKADLHGRDLSGARFEATNLACSNLEACDLSNAHFERANLTGAGFGSGDSGANLCNAQLREAKLTDCDLSGVKGGLQHQQLAGADLTGTALPAALIKSLDSLDVVNDISESARKLFITVLAACLYSWLAIATTTDLNLITNRASSPLPVIQTSIPIVGFYVVAPLLLLCVYFYFQFYLQKLWDELGSLPAIFPDGRRLHERSDPWLLNDLVRAHVLWLKADRPFMSYFQQAISIVVAWWLVPVTLLLFWGRYLPRHDLYWTTVQVALLTVSVTAAVSLYRLAAATLRGAERQPFSCKGALRNSGGYRAVGTFLAIGGAFMLMSVGAIQGAPANEDTDRWTETGQSPGRWGWVPRAMSVVGYSPFAHLREAELSVRPPNWTGRSDSEFDLVKGAQLQGADLRYADVSYAFLVNAYLPGANLEGAQLEHSDLRLAILRDAILSRADLSYAALHRADLLDTDLTQADLTEVDLTGADLVGVSLTGANLSHADLTGANLMETELSDAHLDYANLRGALLTGADLTGADLEGADLTFADFKSDSGLAFMAYQIATSVRATGAFKRPLPRTSRRRHNELGSRATKGLALLQLKKARNWDKAFYDDDLLPGLGLTSDHNKKVEDEQKREQQQEGQPAAGAGAAADQNKSAHVTSTDKPTPRK